jgi:anti-sigma28 factor (negative regulator of flagellin synthesis)
MSVLSRQKDESVAIVENTENRLSEGAGNKARGRITAATWQNSPSLPRVREEKILAIRQQLARGTYDLDRRLNAAVHRLLAVVTT